MDTRKQDAMMNAAVRCVVLSGLVGLAAACGDPGIPTAPSVTTPVPTFPWRDFVPNFPALSRPARMYVTFDGSLLASRYVLYDDGTFALQYASGIEYPGAYKQTDGVVAFDFGSGFGGSRGASGSISEDSLAINYGEIMQHSDFYDGVYRREK